MKPKADLLNYQSYYLVGIKGVAMTALAKCLLDAGKKVAGADVSEDFVTAKSLQDFELKIDEGFEHDLPEDLDCLIYSGAHNGSKNPLVIQAKEKHVATLNHAQALASLFNSKHGIAVCGVGGKSTTSAMISFLLEKLGTQSGWMIGVGNIPGLDYPGKWREDSDYFVAEADDYVEDPSQHQADQLPRARFMRLKPEIIVSTTVRFDHPDVYKTVEDTYQVFNNFYNKLPTTGWLIIDEANQKWLNIDQAQRKIVFFGEKSDSPARIISVKEKGDFTQAQLEIMGKKVNLELAIPGKYNIKNALAALCLVNLLGFDVRQAASHLKDFQSTKRRMEVIKTELPITLIDDYAHHPDEISAAIEAVSARYPNHELLVAFQPHTYSRTKSLFNGFVAALATAKQVVILPIFASARETIDETISSQELVKAINSLHSPAKAKYVTDLNELADLIKKQTKGTVVLTLGAGNIYEVQKYL